MPKQLSNQDSKSLQRLATFGSFGKLYHTHFYVCQSQNIFGEALLCPRPPRPGAAGPLWHPISCRNTGTENQSRASAVSLCRCRGIMHFATRQITIRAVYIPPTSYDLTQWDAACVTSCGGRGVDSRTALQYESLPGTHHIRRFSNADDLLIKTILKNSYHVLYPYLSENQYQHHYLRQHPHNKALIPKTTYLSDRDYIMRMLYGNCYQPTLTPCCGTVITHCAYVVCYFRDVYPFICFIIAM